MRCVFGVKFGIFTVAEHIYPELLIFVFVFFFCFIVIQVDYPNAFRTVCERKKNNRTPKSGTSRPVHARGDRFCFCFCFRIFFIFLFFKTHDFSRSGHESRALRRGGESPGGTRLNIVGVWGGGRDAINWKRSRVFIYIYYFPVQCSRMMRTEIRKIWIFGPSKMNRPNALLFL